MKSLQTIDKYVLINLIAILSFGIFLSIVWKTLTYISAATAMQYDCNIAVKYCQPNLKHNGVKYFLKAKLFGVLLVHWFRNVFSVFDFFQKTNENKLTWGTSVLKSNSFICFLEESSAWKNLYYFIHPSVASNVVVR